MASALHWSTMGLLVSALALAPAACTFEPSTTAPPDMAIDGGPSDNDLLSAIGDNELVFHRPYNAITARWVGVDDRERMVLHVVYDAMHADPERRVDLYKNGVLVDKTTSNPPPMGPSETLSTGSDFIIGNHQGLGQSIAGTIYYVAYFDRPLTALEVVNNAQRLLARDDQ